MPDRSVVADLARALPLRARALIAALFALLAALGVAAAPASAGEVFFNSADGITKIDDQGNGRTVVHKPATQEAGGDIALDGAYLYWISKSTTTRDVYIGRMGRDGSNPEPKWVTDPSLALGGETLAAGGGHICWSGGTYVGNSVGPYVIRCVGSGGGAYKELYSSTTRSVSGLAVNDSYVYWGNLPVAFEATSTGAIARVPVGGGTPELQWIPNVTYARSIAVNSSKIVWRSAHPQSNNPPPDGIFSAPITGGGPTQLVNFTDKTASIGQIAAAEGAVYWVTSKSAPGGQQSTIGRVNIDGSSQNASFFAVGSSIYYLAASGASACDADVIDFHTSMVAKGCFSKTGEHTYKAKGKFRLNGIDLQSPDDDAVPITFDTEKKTVDGEQAQLSLSADGWGENWFAFYVPGGLHLSFPNSSIEWSWVLKTPLSATQNLAGRAGGFLQLTGFGSSLFGWPAHAPAVKFESRGSSSSLTVQVSIPTTSNAYLDPINGLWKVNGRISYPNGVAMKVSANNDHGVDYIEGTFSPADIYGIDTTKSGRASLVSGGKGAPAASVIEIAKLRFAWELSKGIVHAGGVLVFHTKPGEAATSALPKDYFIGRTVMNVDLAMQWAEFPRFGGAVLPYPVHLGASVNSINKLVFPEAALFWQRIALDGGINTNDPARPWHLGGGVGFSFLPRFKHDFLWFQEAASVDAAGDLEISPFRLDGQGTLKAANVDLIRGAFSIGPEGAGLEGNLGLDWNQFLHTGFPMYTKGTARLVFPADGQGWQMEGVGGTALGPLSLSGRMLWNDGGIGFCTTAGKMRGRGVYYDKGWQVGGCEGGPFQTARKLSGIRVGLHGAGPSEPTGGKESFTPGVSPLAARQQTDRGRTLTIPGSRKVVGVEIRGVGAAPYVTVTGPGGLNLTVDPANLAASQGDAALIVTPKENTTTLIFGKPTSGKFTITPSITSVAIKGFSFSQSLPPARVSARVTAAPQCKRTVSWSTKAIAGQKLTFLERAGATDRIITSTSASRGRVTFKPSISKELKRKVFVRVEQRGTPRQILKLATYKASNVTPTRVRNLKAKRSGKDKVNLSWAGGGCGTMSYTVTKVAPDGTFSTVAETTKKHVKVAIDPVVKRKKGEKAPRTTYYVEAVGPQGDYAPSVKVIVKS